MTDDAPTRQSIDDGDMVGDTADRADETTIPEMADRHPAPYGDITDFIGFKLRLAQECVFRGFAQAVNDPTLKPRRFTALSFIAQHPGMSQSDLGAMVGRDKSTITPMISDLIVSGYVRREQTAMDRRSFRLYLTPAGQQVLEKQWEIARAHEARIDAIVGVGKKAEFLDQLDRLIAAFS